jgi:expansin (peptidoglycan-binding protein)
MTRLIQLKQLIRTRLWVVTAVSLLAVLIGVSLSVDVAAQATGDHFTYLPLVTNPPGAVLFGATYTGEGTYYDFADGDGNCAFGPSPDDLMVAAINAAQYNNAALCGAYAAVTGPKGSVTVRIVDQCPECPHGDLDFSPEAFVEIADLPQGRVPISWQLVSPVLDGPIVYHYKSDSHEYWSAVQIRNHRNPITHFEFMNTNGVFQEVPRESYNYFHLSGIGTGPFTFRVTDYFGNMIVDSNVSWIPGGDVPSQHQFPPPS